MRKLLLLLPVALLSLALGLAACGGGGSEGSDDEAQIENTIVESITSNDPTKCTRYQTLDFVEQNTDSKGTEALISCREAAADTSGDPKEVTVSAIEVDGNDATAHVAYVGGGLDQQVVAVALVKEGKNWKLDQLTGYVAIEHKAMAKTMERLLKEGIPNASKAQVKCFGDEFRDISKAKAKELLLGNSSQGLVELAESCR